MPITNKKIHFTSGNEMLGLFTHLMMIVSIIIFIPITHLPFQQTTKQQQLIDIENLKSNKNRKGAKGRGSKKNR
jgi:hypothetical protein